jgi:hypothetical protein
MNGYCTTTLELQQTIFFKHIPDTTDSLSGSVFIFYQAKPDKIIAIFTEANTR